MEQIRNTLREVLTETVLEQIIRETDKVMDQNYRALSERASGMAAVHTYQQLLDYCYQQTGLYLDNRDNMKKVLLDANNIPSVYHSVVESEEFKAICAEEYKGFPRVIMMTILAGSEAAAANAAAGILETAGADAQLVQYEDDLCTTYQKYLRDAIAYGKGEDKKIVMAGEHRA